MTPTARAAWLTEEVYADEPWLTTYFFGYLARAGQGVRHAT